MIPMGPFRNSIRVRLTVWFVLLLALLLAAFGAGVYLLLRQSLYQNLDESIESRAGTLVDLVRIEDGRPYLELQSTAAGLDPEERLNRLFDRNGLLISEDVANNNFPVNRVAVAKSLAGESVSYRVQGGTEAEEMRVRTFPLGPTVPAAPPAPPLKSISTSPPDSTVRTPFTKSKAGSSAVHLPPDLTVTLL